MNLPPDFRDLLAAFAAEKVSYLLIGGYAVAFHGRPRFIKDLDLCVPVRVLSLPDLLTSKRAAGREQDLQDVRVLEAMAQVKRGAT